MNNYIILDKKKHLKRLLKFKNNLNLKESFKNNRTTILENEDIQISIDKTIIRILIFCKDDVERYVNLFTKE